MSRHSILILLNQRLLPESEVRIAPGNHGFLFGEGVFETLRADQGHPFMLPEHLTRMRRGLQRLGLAEPEGLTNTGELCRQLLEANHLAKRPAVIKLIISRDTDATPETPPLFLIRAAPLDLEAIARRRAGLKATIAPWRRDRANPLLRIKSLNYLENRFALEWARKRGYNEAIFMNLDGELCEGSFTNLFLVLKKGQILTPPTEAGLLPGITRRFILEQAPALGLEIREAPLSPQILADCHGAFLTSSLMDLAPLTRLADHSFRPAATQKLYQLLLHAFVTARRGSNG